MSLHTRLLAPNDKADVTELLLEQKPLKVIDQGTLGEGRELDPVQLPATAGLGIDGPSKHVHGVVADCCRVEHASTRDLAPLGRLDDAPGP